jgi:hypothetical protein
MHDLIVAVAFTNMCGGTQGIEAFNVARRPPIRLHDEGYAKGTQKCQHESESLCPPRCVSPVELPKWSEDCAKRGDVHSGPGNSPSGLKTALRGEISGLPYLEKVSQARYCLEIFGGTFCLVRRSSGSPWTQQMRIHIYVHFVARKLDLIHVGALLYQAEV